MTNFHIRPAGVDDAQGIATVHVQSWQHAYRGQIPDEYLDSLSIDERAQRWQRILSESRPNTQTLIAEDETIMGFCSIGPSRDEDATPDTGEVYALYVGPDHMRRGVGAALLTAGTTALIQAGYTPVTLWVLTTNLAAQSFYQAQGYAPDGAIKTDSIRGSPLNEFRYVYRIPHAGE